MQDDTNQNIRFIAVENRPMNPYRKTAASPVKEPDKTSVTYQHQSLEGQRRQGITRRDTAQYSRGGNRTLEVSVSTKMLQSHE